VKVVVDDSTTTTTDEGHGSVEDLHDISSGGKATLGEKEEKRILY